MIPKTITLNTEGSGLPFEITARAPIEKNDAERQKKVLIDLTALNGQKGGKGMPKNYIRRAGRTLPTFSEYWTGDEDADDIQ